jgi:superfamily I DNA/RNA helicase
MTPDEIRAEITAPVRLEERPDLEDMAAALSRTQVTTVDDDVRTALEEGDFRAWKVFLHPTQARVAHANYRGPARVSGGPGTGKTIVALHRVEHLLRQLPPGGGKPILLTTYTANLASDLRMRLAYLLTDPADLARVDVTHIDQLAARVLGENTSAHHRKRRVSDQAALTELRQLLAELGETAWDADFLFDEWEQVILGQSVTTRAEYFQVRRAGRGRALTRLDRNQVWKLVEQLTARLDKLGIETWGQAAERAARYENERARRISERVADDSSGRGNLTYRYRHVIVDEAQDLRSAHWKMLRAMVPAGPNDLFIAGDTHQRVYDHHVTLGPLGINIRGRSSRLTLSYRTTREILAWALRIVSNGRGAYDDLDDGTDTLAGYRSVLHGRRPTVEGHPTWDGELEELAKTLIRWRARLSTSKDQTAIDPAGRIAVCVADRDLVGRTIDYLTAQGLTCAELTKDGPRGDGQIHVGTMHRFKGLEYQNLAIVAVTDGIIPRAAVHRYATEDRARYTQELRKAQSLLFVAATRARDTLALSWHGPRSPLIPHDEIKGGHAGGRSLLVEGSGGE